MADLPSGTVTFLFTDIEGSTRLWEEHPEAMRQALLQHDDLLRACIESHGGRVFKTMGDAFCAVFANPRGAIETILASQQRLPALGLQVGDELQPLRVRMALHTGVAEERDGDYFGPPLNRIARLLAIGRGGQVLLTAATRELLAGNLPRGATLQERGSHRLRDLSQPEQVYQLLHPSLRAVFPPLRSLSTHPNNLPHQLTSFIGREKEIEQLDALLGRSRLVTLTGSGGCGKTRLALHVAAELLEAYPDGVWLVELAALSDPALVPQSVASVFGLKEEPGRPILQTLGDYLRSRRLLLALDNCEHLRSACAELAGSLLRQCSQVRILASSREGLGIAGEQIYRVPSLSLPDPHGSESVESLLASEAARLFLDRALLQRADFTLTGKSAGALAQICCRLDGIPLAIELAAARVRSLSVGEIRAGLDDRFRLLTGGSRTALPRQRTLRSLLDWSYDLLTGAEQALLQRVSVFASGWTLAAAEEVCSDCGLRIADCGLGDGTPEPGHSAIRPPASRVPAQSAIEEWKILDLLTSLCDKSLVVAEQRQGATRYRLLETVRQYARDRLLEGGDGATWRERHLAHYLALAEEFEPQLRGPEQTEWLERLEAEHDNVRAALQWGLESEDGADAGLRLAGALAWFWLIRGYLSEGRERLSRALAVGAGAAGRAKALNGAGNLAWQQGDHPAARALHEESLAIFRDLGDRRGSASLLINLGNVANEQGDYPTARVLYEEGLAIWRELRDPGGIAASLHNLGNVANEQGDYPTARMLYEESLAIRRGLGDQRSIAASLGNLGVVAEAQGDYPAARALYEESLEIFRDLGDRGSTANSLGYLGSVALVEGDTPTARARHEESLAIRRDLGDRRGIAWSLGHLGSVSVVEGDDPTAEALHGEGLAIFRDLGDRRGIAWSLSHLGNMAKNQGDHVRARARHEQSLVIRRDLSDREGIAVSLEGMAALAAVVGTPLHTSRLWGAAERLREEIGSPMQPSDRLRYEREVAGARAAVNDDAAFDAAWQQGRAMTLEQAIEVAQALEVGDA